MSLFVCSALCLSLFPSFDIFWDPFNLSVSLSVLIVLLFLLEDEMPLWEFESSFFLLSRNELEGLNFLYWVVFLPMV